MEVERLTATLDAAGLAGFTAAMGAADKATGSVSEELKSLAAIARIADAALAGVKITSGQAAETQGALATMERSVSGVTATALAAADALAQVEVGPAQAATTAASSAEMVAALNAVEAAAADTRRSLEGLAAANAGAAATGGAAGAGGLLAAAGWGRGGNARLPFTGLGFGGMAAFGSTLGLAGFGLEHVITSIVGVGGSMLGGLAGGGLLGLGALGTSAVGMGTDMAGIGQAAGDIKQVTTGLGTLQTAIQTYGRNSQQAAQAQAQLNASLHSFSPVAQGAVLAASETARGFRAMFDQVSGQAEKTGAQIIDQAMHVGESFLPTIGMYATQNMGIIQHQLQPLFAWLQNPGFSGPGMGGGLGIFTNLEQIFQRNLPSAVQAGSQALEFFVRTVDVAAQQTGHLMATLDQFFTHMNTPAAFSSWAGEVNKLISLFRTWMGLLGSLVGLVADVFKPAVGFGQAFAQELTNIINQVRAWLSLGSTQSTLQGLFSVHLVEVIQGLGGVIQALLPPVEAATTAFMKMETVVSGIAAGALKALAALINTIMRIPFSAQVIGWAGALTLVYKANQLLFGAMGRATGLASAQVSENEALTASLNELTAAIERLTAAQTGLAASTRVATESEGLFSITAEDALGVTALRGGIGGALGKAAPWAIGGLLAGSAAQSMIGGGTGQAIGRTLEFAGIGAAAGSVIPGLGTLTGAGLGALVGAMTTFIHQAPAMSQQLEKLSSGLNQMTVGSQQGQQAVSAITGQLESMSNVLPNAGTPLAQLEQNIVRVNGGTTTGAAKLQVYMQHMNSLSESLASSDPKMAKVIDYLTQIAATTNRIPSRKTIEIVVNEVFHTSGRNLIPGDLFAPGAVSGGPTANVVTQLPQKLALALAKAEAGKGNIAKADKAAYDFYQRQLDQQGLTRKQRLELYQLMGEYYQGTGASVHTRGVPKVQQPKTYNPYGTGQYQLLPAYLQSAMLQAQTKVDLTGASTATGSLTGKQLAALRDLENSDKRALDWLDKQHATGQKLLELERERQQVAQQLAQTEQQIAQAMGTRGYVNAQGGFQMPLAVQLAMAKADALAALIPGAQGLTPQQMKLALQVKAAVMRAINSHRLTMQGLIDAWNEIATINAELAQSMGMIDTYHTVASHSITDAVKGLTRLQKIQLDERISQAEAHRGHAPNGPAVLGEPVRGGHHGHSGRRHPLYTGPGGGVTPGTAIAGAGIVINGDVYVNADTKKDLYKELERHGRSRQARRGVRR